MNRENPVCDDEICRIPPQEKDIVRYCNAASNEIMEGKPTEKDAAREPSNAFLRAFHQYVRNLPEKKNKKSVLSRIDLNDPPTPESIHQAMRTMEAKHSQKLSVKLMKRILGPAISAMKDYYGVLDTITQADPTPGMVVWGALKIVIDGLGRFVELFDKIKAEVMSLTTHLTRLVLYEHLYGQSTEMQEHLFRSYVNIFRFWCRVDKECNRCSLSTLLRATASFSLKKLQSIVDDLKENADEIDKLVPIIEGQYAGTEREEARLERSKNQIERDENSEWRRQMLCDHILSWLGEKMFNEATLTRHQNNLDAIKSEGTCDWLINNPDFHEWVTGLSIKPILWLFAGPGTGKSILCSHAYRYVEAADFQIKPAVAIQFYEFDNQHSATAVARGLAAQLFEDYRCLYPELSEDVRQASQRNAANLSTVLQFIQVLTRELPRTYIFFDGLDEECSVSRWKEAVKIIDFFMSLAEAFPKTVRVWFGSQNKFLIRSKLRKFPTLNIKDQIRDAVDDFISSQVPGLENPEVDHSSRDWILTELKNRADGNFLWATLMLKTIENDANSFEEMEELVREGLPRDLDHYYHQMFARYETTERELASKIFAMITFAKRRLRLSELREAIGIISSSDPKTLRQTCIPWRKAVEKLFAPLIETQPDPQNKDDCFCHLFHGTVETFLLKNEGIFLLDEPKNTHIISEAAISHACLLYLLQDKYSQFLVSKSDQWFTTSEETVAGHHFLTYSAKYWDKHLDSIKFTTDLQRKVEDFLMSKNFRTLLQIQSLFVESQFGVFSVSGHCEHRRYLRRVLPAWFVASNLKRDIDFSANYRSFINEWRRFLDCGTCQHQGCVNSKFAGELDRYLWKALGPQNFLSAYPDRYNSFMLSNNRKMATEEPALYYDGVASDGSRVAVMQLSQGGLARNPTNLETKLQMCQDTWNLNARPAPSSLFRTNVNTQLDPGRWKIFTKDSGVNSSNPVSFSPDLSYIRIGFRLFSLISNDHYEEICGLELAIDKQPHLYEHVVNRGSILVLASRQKLPKSTKARDKPTSSMTGAEGKTTKRGSSLSQELPDGDCYACSQELSRLNKDQMPSPTRSPNPSIHENNDDRRTEQDSAHEDSNNSSSERHSSSSAFSNEWDSGEESWSEGSTDVAQYSQLPWKELDTSEEDNQTEESENSSSSEREDSEDEKSTDDPATSYGQLLIEDESDGGDINFGIGSDDDAYQGDSDNSGAGFLSDSGNEDALDMRIFMRALAKPRVKYEKGHLVIHDLAHSPPRVLFQLSPLLPLMLYDSPPIIHPTKPLVVWPLCGGDILFVDFEGRTHFTRRARPTTKETRHISMKCHFSSCGQYLHLVSLEAQQRLPSKTNRKASKKSFLVLSAFVSTHRLSTRKTVRSPPVLIHRTKASLGTTTSLNPNVLPVEINWGSDHVFLSASSESNLLSLLRIELFPSKNEQSKNTIEAQNATITVPKLPILLPQSAQARKVHYFPPSKPHRTCGLIILGSWTCDRNRKRQTSDNKKEAALDESFGHPEKSSPPIGFYVNEEKDLGGWIPSNAMVEIDPGDDKGMLKAKLERFAPVDDCDIEHYFFQHPPKY